jgi:hypothetical protein
LHAFLNPSSSESTSRQVPHFIFAITLLLSLLPSAAGHGYVAAFVTTVVLDQLNAKDAFCLTSDIGPVKGADNLRTPPHQPILELRRPESPAGNHGHTGQREPEVGDGVLLEKSCCGNVSFSHPKLLLFS